MRLRMRWCDEHGAAESEAGHVALKFCEGLHAAREREGERYPDWLRAAIPYGREDAAKLRAAVPEAERHLLDPLLCEEPS